MSRHLNFMNLKKNEVNGLNSFSFLFYNQTYVIAIINDTNLYDIN